MILSTSTEVNPFKSVIVSPSDVSSEPIVIPSFASFAFAIEPASSSLLTPPFLIVTTPDDTEKLSELNEATPLLDVLASSPAIVISSSDTVVSIPSPPVNVSVPPVENESLLPLSAASVKVLVIEPNDKTPEPSVFRNCHALPSALGKSNATPLDVNIRCPPSDEIDSFASWNCNVGVPPESCKSNPVSAT